MALNTITVSFNGQNETITKKRYQYDKGQVCVFDDIELPEAYKVIFSNNLTGENSIPMIGGENGVKVPDDFFLTGLTIYGWVYLSEGDDDGQTVKHFTIPVEKRVRETDEEPTPEEQTEIEQLIVALNGAVNTAETAAENAGNSARQAKTAAEHYPIIEGGYWYVWDVESEDYVSTGIKALGDDGTSPTVTVTAITGGHRVTITDVDGDHVFEVMDGTNGNGIQSIAKTSTAGNVDTYTITYTNGQTTTFTVTNGITPTVDDALSPTSTNPVQNKVIDAEIGELKAEINHLSNNKADIIISNASGTVASFSDGADGLPVESLDIDVADGTAVTVTRTGKNLFSSVLVKGKNISSDGSITNSNTRTATVDAIKVIGNLNYVISYGNSGLRNGIFYYDKDDVFISYLAWGDNGRTFTTPQNAALIRVVFDSNTDVVAPQLELGSTATAYEPYKDNTYSFITPYDANTGEITTLLGVNNIWSDTGDTDVTYRADTKLYLESRMPDVPVDDVQVNGTSILSNGIANIPYADADNYGLIKTGAKTVSGTTPSITAMSGVRYVCGEVATLSITPPASGDCEIMFTSGSTPTVLTVPNTVKWANGFDPTSLDANTVYDMIITDGIYGMVASWAV